MSEDEPKLCDATFNGEPSQLEHGHDGVCMTVSGLTFSHEDRD